MRWSEAGLGLALPAAADAPRTEAGPALGPEIAAGHELFVSIGCVTCHEGLNAGRTGRVVPVARADGPGGDPELLEVPALRDVARRAPYFHDGSVATLEEAVRIMARVQLGEDLDPAAVSTLVAFLEALSDEPRADG